MMSPYDPNRPPLPPPYPSPYSAPVQLADKGAERALSALAHGAIAFGFLGITFLVTLGITAVIWLYSKRSPEVRFHAAQAGTYQCLVVLINLAFIVVLGVGGGFSIVGMFRGGDAGLAHWVAWGFVVFVGWFLLSIGYGLFAALMVLLGKRFKYPLIGDRFEKKVW